jgi:hypothetical protein
VFSKKLIWLAIITRRRRGPATWRGTTSVVDWRVVDWPHACAVGQYVALRPLLARALSIRRHYRGLEETLPTGKYDHLGSRSSDGLGAGAFTTTIALYTRTFFWMPNGRILRMRSNFVAALARSVQVEDVSVYGTSQGFRGRAHPGSSWLADLAAEYSVTQRWVLAVDAASAPHPGRGIQHHRSQPAHLAELRNQRRIRLSACNRIQLEKQHRRSGGHTLVPRRSQYRAFDHPGNRDQLRPLKLPTASGCWREGRTGVAFPLLSPAI